jgi:hypothetical protein
MRPYSRKAGQKRYNFSLFLLFLIILLPHATISQGKGLFQLEENSLDQITIPANGNIVESNIFLEAHIRYTIVVTGLYRYDIGEPGEYADAQYREDDNDQWTIRFNSVEFDGNRLSASKSDLGNHTYIFYVTGQGQQMTFRIYDEPGSYSDNDGYLTATLYLYEPGEYWNPATDTPFDWYRFDCIWYDDGSGPSIYNQKVYCPGGRTGLDNEQPDIWKYDPLSDIWSDTGIDMVEDVSNYTANLLWDERGLGIYVVGGYDRDHTDNTVNYIQRYYPANSIIEIVTTDPWPGTLGGLPTIPGACVSVFNDLRIFCFGGNQNSVAPYNVENFYSYDPSQPPGSRWSANANANLPQPRGFIQAAVLDNFIYAMGGDTYNGSDLSPHAEVYRLNAANPGLGWVQLASMPVASGEGRGFGFSVDTLQMGVGKVYVVGGGDWPGNTVEVMEYDIATNTWNQAFSDLIEPRRNQAGFYIPLCTSDPTDGLPGMWVVGGWLSDDAPPFANPEYYPLECQGLTAEIDLIKTIGKDPSTCASTNRLVVPVGTEVTYCYHVTNTGELNLSLHDLSDDQIGNLLVDYPYTLAPGASFFITASATITQNTTNEATWTAWIDETNFTEDSDTAQVYISRGTAFLPLTMSSFIQYFPGPWELEDNDTSSQANGYLYVNQDYYGYPDDQRDWFSIYLTQPGNFSVNLSGHSGEDVQLHVYAQVVDADHRVCYVGVAPYVCEVDGQVGSYFLLIYTDSGFNTSTPYALQITAP